MRQYTRREFIRICESNGFRYNRTSGSHDIYVGDNGRHISVPWHLNSVMIPRLIKENNLETDIKKLKRDRKMDNYNYPPGAEYDSNAPWNKEEKPPRKVECLVSVTLSKTVEVEVSDYTVTASGKDEEGDYFEDVDFSDCDLMTAVHEQVTLPSAAGVALEDIRNRYIKVTDPELIHVIKDLSDWHVDEMEVIKE